MLTQLITHPMTLPVVLPLLMGLVCLLIPNVVNGLRSLLAVLTTVMVLALVWPLFQQMLTSCLPLLNAALCEILNGRIEIAIVIEVCFVVAQQADDIITDKAKRQWCESAGNCSRNRD